MSEAELLNEVHFLLERSNYLTQWWASMSLGLILVAHFAKESLNLVFVSLLLLLIYISFSVNMWGQFIDALVPISAFRADLEILRAAGSTAMGTDAILAREGARLWDVFTYPVSLIGLFLGSIYYLVYSYMQARKHSTN